MHVALPAKLGLADTAFTSLSIFSTATATTSRHSLLDANSFSNACFIHRNGFATRSSAGTRKRVVRAGEQNGLEGIVAKRGRSPYVSIETRTG